jgi:hypothetical protein
MGYHALLFYDVAFTEMNRTGKSWGTVCGEIMQELKNNGVDIGGDIHGLEARKIKYTSSYKEYSTDYIRNHPYEFIFVHLKNSILCYLNVGVKGIVRMMGYKSEDLPQLYIVKGNVLLLLKHMVTARPMYELIIFVVIAFYLLFVYILSAIGIYAAVVDKKYLYTILLTLLILYFTFTLGAMGNSARYRLPMVPLYTIFAGYGFTFIYAKRNRYKDNHSIPLDINMA